MSRPSKRAADIGFAAITIEGGLIAPEQIVAIAAASPDQKLAAEYGCPKGTSLRDEITRYFRIAQAHWQAYALIEGPTVTQTAGFVKLLLEDSFGFSLTGPTTHERDGRRFRIAWEAKGGRVPIVVAAPVASEKGKLAEGFSRAQPEFGDGPAGRVARRSPAVLLQDWLNANPDFYWGLVFSGDRVRLMRDNASFTRPAFIEADLGAIFRDEMFADFAALWLLIHASRFGAAGAPASDCALERWREAGMRAGTAARDRLRGNVEDALLSLGQGFLDANAPLRQRLDDGSLSMSSYFEQLLRIIYRLIFLAVAEDRGLLHPPGTGAAAKELYAENYGFAYLRDRSSRRAAHDHHLDAWEGVKIVFKGLEGGEKLLGLPALGSLFASAMTPDLDQVQISNRALLGAVFKLAWLLDSNRRVRINWRDMATEELGSVYEGLLELTPTREHGGDTFSLFGSAAGNARKLSGSYYTPDSLVQTLLDSALDPVLDRAEAEGGVEGILDLSVIDPACGSGHFLLGAARRMATRIAQIRDPDAPNYHVALRDVVARCIHGVDRNPMAVELAKVALWIESVSPGQPLGFLDANIRCGDALLGVFDLEALEQGIPDDAYKHLTGDDRDAASYYKKKNKDEKKGQGALDFESGSGAMPPRKLAANLSTIRRMSEDTVGQVEKKREAFDAWRHNPERWATKVACDLYTAAFLLPKVEVPDNYQRATVPTTADVWKKLGGGTLYGPLEAAALDAAEFARAFHWPLAFPDVLIGKGGFDVVLGNPPWERIKLQEQEFFAGHEVADAPNAAARSKAIAKLAQAEEGSAGRRLYDAFQIAKRVAEATSLFARVSGADGGRYAYTGTGDVNTYALFSEHFLNLLGDSGRAGIIVPTGIATDATTAPFFSHLIEQDRIRSLHDFRNKGFFEGVAQAQGVRFALLTLGKPKGDEQVRFAFKLESVADLENGERCFSLAPSEIALINPNTKTAPIFRTRYDAQITADIYKRVPVFVREDEERKLSCWDVAFLRMLDMASDSHHFRSEEQLSKSGYVQEGVFWKRAEHSVDQSLSHDEGGLMLPLYEAKMLHHFNHRHGDYLLARVTAGKDFRQIPQASAEQMANPNYEVTPRYWVEHQIVRQKPSTSGWEHQWVLGWRDVTSSIDERTLISSFAPLWGINHKFQLLLARSDVRRISALGANLSSITCDFVARQKLGGTSFSYFVIKQLPILPPSSYSEDDLAFIVPRVLELSYTSHSMAPFARDLGYAGEPFRWDEDRRAHLRAELDAWYALAYGLNRDELRYVLDPKDVMGEDYPSETFRVLKNNEIKKHGEYRTRRLVLAAYDKLVSEGMRPRVEGYR